MRSRPFSVLAFTLALAASPAWAAESYRLDIPAQPLVKALQSFATQSGLSLVHYAKLTDAKMAPAIEGNYTSEEALARLLEGSGLQYSYLNERTIEIRAAAGRGDARKISGALFTGDGSIMLADAGTVSGTGAGQGGQGRQGGQTESGPDTAAARSEALEEIIVTATKRAESARNVPLSITAIGNGEIEARGLEGMGDYLAAVPGVSFIENNSTSHSVIIRGISTSPISENFGAGTTVATYFGETPITNSAGLIGGSGIDVKLADIERIEILRGPQGTAFGNSAMGGTVRTIPVAPKLDAFGGKVVGSFSGTGGTGGSNFMVQGVFNAPLIADRLALRIVGYKYDYSGYYDNVSVDDPAARDYAESLGPQAVSLLGDADDRGGYKNTGARAALLFQATEDLKLNLSYLHQQTRQLGFSYSEGLNGGYGYTGFDILPSRALHGSTDGAIDSRIDLANATMEYGFSWADLVASASYIDSESEWAFGAAVFAPYDNNARSPYQSFTAELRLVSRLQGPFQFVAGLWHERVDDRDDELYSSLETPELELLNAGYGDGVNEVLGDYDVWRKLKQDAVFGEATYAITDRLILGFGARVYDYKRDNRTESSGWFFGAPLGDPNVSIEKIGKSGKTYKADLTWKLADAAMAYARFSQGFRLGRPAPGLIPAVCDADGDGTVDGTGIDIESTKFIKSDTIDNYELGAKTTLAGGRAALEASVFRIDWKGVPTNATAECSGATYGYIANAGEARSQGFELESSFAVAKGLRFDVSGSYTKAQLTADAPGLGAFDGDRLPASPRVIGHVGVQKDFVIAGRPAFARGDAAYRGSFYGDLAQTELTKTPDHVRLDVRFGMTFDKLDVELFVDNLTDVDEFIWRGTFNATPGAGQYMRPRTVGLQLGYEF